MFYNDIGKFFFTIGSKEKNVQQKFPLPFRLFFFKANVMYDHSRHPRYEPSSTPLVYLTKTSGSYLYVSLLFWWEVRDIPNLTQCGRDGWWKTSTTLFYHLAKIQAIARTRLYGILLPPSFLTVAAAKTQRAWHSVEFPSQNLVWVCCKHKRSAMQKSSFCPILFSGGFRPSNLSVGLVPQSHCLPWGVCRRNETDRKRVNREETNKRTTILWCPLPSRRAL